MFMRLVHATSVAFFREKTNATEVACTGNAAQLFAGHNTMPSGHDDIRVRLAVYPERHLAD
jgi:hypothetical protein